MGEVAKAMNGDDQAPAIVLLGHRYNRQCVLHKLCVCVLFTYCSMGGAIAVRVAAAGLIPSLVGLAVIDVVEGEPFQEPFVSLSSCLTPQAQQWIHSAQCRTF